jgi:Glycosyltransferases, probably involved in cell wall biogenesis
MASKDGNGYMMSMINQAMSILFNFVGEIILLYMLVVLCFYFTVFIVSAIELKKLQELDDVDPYEELIRSYDTKPISILVPAHNEAVGIRESVSSLLSLIYPEYEIIVINDASTDNTLEVMIHSFKMERIPVVIRKTLKCAAIHAVYRSKLSPNVYLIDKDHGGKADSLNAGITLSRFPYFCTIDGDSVLERNALLKVMKPIIDSNESIIAVGGSVRIANGCTISSGEVMNIRLDRNPIVIMQVIEYLRAFLIGRIGLSKYNILMIVSGAFGVFNKKWAIKAGGYNTKTVGEDMELVVRLHQLIKDEKQDKKIKYIPDPVCWTEAPSNLRMLWRQRARWNRGLCETLWMHRKMLFNPKYKYVGLISLPYFFFIELLGTLVEFIGYLILIFGSLFSLISVTMSVLLFCFSLLLGSLLSMCGVLLEEWSLKRYPKVMDLVALFFFALTETFWYRPLTTFFRFTGILQIFSHGNKWKSMERKGLASKGKSNQVD